MGPSLDIWGGGGRGGARVFVACKLFFYLRWKTSFFLAINVQQFFFMLCRRNFLSYAFPIMYVTIWYFFRSTHFSSISTTNFFFSSYFQQTFFFWLLWRQTIFFNFNLAPPPLPDIKWCAPYEYSTMNLSKDWLTNVAIGLGQTQDNLTKILNKHKMLTMLTKCWFNDAGPTLNQHLPQISVFDTIYLGSGIIDLHYFFFNRPLSF